MSIESEALSAVEGVAGTAVSAVIPSPLKYLKLAGLAVAAIAAGILIWKVLAYVELAQVNAARVGILTTQLATAESVNAADLVAINASEAQHRAVESGYLAAIAKAAAENSDLKQSVEGLQNEQNSPTVCVPTAGMRAVLDGLRAKPAAAHPDSHSAASAVRKHG